MEIIHAQPETSPRPSSSLWGKQIGMSVLEMALDNYITHPRTSIIINEQWPNKRKNNSKISKGLLRTKLQRESSLEQTKEWKSTSNNAFENKSYPFISWLFKGKEYKRIIIILKG